MTLLTATASDEIDFNGLMRKHQKLLRQFVEKAVPLGRRKEELDKLDSMEMFDSSSNTYKMYQVLFNRFIDLGVEIESFSELKTLKDILEDKDTLDVDKVFSTLGIRNKLTTGMRQAILQNSIKQIFGLTIAPPIIIEDPEGLETPDFMYEEPESLAARE